MRDRRRVASRRRAASSASRRPGSTPARARRASSATARRSACSRPASTTDDVERILELVPIATHNQRGRQTLFVGTERRLDAELLVDIVERSMSAPIYELLKRPDELFVVEHAHLQPRFVEDSVRHRASRRARRRYPQLDDDDFLLSQQVNFETIHVHDVVAERFGTVGELRGELGDGRAEPAPDDALRLARRASARSSKRCSVRPRRAAGCSRDAAR